ncbi:DUF2690 domain-containing protein [Mangrovihabitans endophyticus]|uniref:DUF2690 domain-containing protein n=1 Tax=Mangrovihabitans endophyticus TaxID=1751298 RepID=A0A8J3C3U5_9ACTN|nr:DUF2690 domain-containing protein [Mangrovihabitans endophyticus]GGL13614.1 hypothetical protein GCM10012284_55510 [Mangrovihabitans endophyticus]
MIGSFPRLATVAAAVTLGAAGAVVVATPAAASLCHGSSCTGRWPEATGCDEDAVTAKSAWTPARRIELRYSRTCRAVWARTTNGRPGDRIRVVNTQSIAQSKVLAAGQTYAWTKMVNDANIFARACLTQNPSGLRGCTDWY